MSGRRHGRCLGDRVVDLADGRLGPAATEAAYDHVAACPNCRVALETQREILNRLHGAAAVEPSADLLSRLRGIADPAGPSETRTAGTAGTDRGPIPEQAAPGVRPSGSAGPRPASTPTPTSTRPAPPTRTGRRRPGRVAFGAAAGAAALAVAAVMGTTSASLSSPSHPSPSIAPVVDRLTDTHAVTADQMPFSGPRIVTVGFSGSTDPAGSSSPAP